MSPGQSQKTPSETVTSATAARRRRSPRPGHRTGAAPRRRTRSSRTTRFRYPARGRDRGRRSRVAYRTGCEQGRLRREWARTGAMPRPARLVDPRYSSTSASISACGMGGRPGLGGAGRPSTVWKIRDQGAARLQQVVHRLGYTGLVRPVEGQAKATIRNAPGVAAGRSSARACTQLMFVMPCPWAKRRPSASMAGSGSRPTASSKRSASRTVRMPGPQPTSRASAPIQAQFLGQNPSSCGE